MSLGDRMMKMKTTSLCVGLAMALTMSTNAWAEITIKVGHGAAETYHMNKAWVKFKELVEKDSNNEIKVNIFPNGQLGGDRELIEAVQSGIVDMTSPVVEVLAGLDPLSVPLAFHTCSLADLRHLRPSTANLAKNCWPKLINMASKVWAGWKTVSGRSLVIRVQ